MKLNLSRKQWCQHGALILLTVFALVVVEAQTTRRNIPKPPDPDEINKLQNRLSWLEYRLDHLDSQDATVHAEENGYAVGRTKFGPFTVVQKGVTPYLDGYKLKLSIGNPTFLFFYGADLKLSWGPPYDANDSKAWAAAQKSKTVSVTDTFRPGTETQIEVILTPAKPEDIKEVSVGMTFNQLSYTR